MLCPWLFKLGFEPWEEMNSFEFPQMPSLKGGFGWLFSAGLDLARDHRNRCRDVLAWEEIPTDAVLSFASWNCIKFLLVNEACLPAQSSR